jgi:hypothetical protein
MTKNIKAEVVAHSRSTTGARIMTALCTIPRWALPELNTHGQTARNSESSRAVPPEKKIRSVLDNPYIPDFRRRVTGMGAGELVSPEEQEFARMHWLAQRDHAVETAQHLIDMNLDKSRVNRLLEPFMYHTVIITATNWGNLLGQRCPVGDVPDMDFPAQEEFQELAIDIRNILRDDKPRILGPGEWHLPFVTEEEREAWYGSDLYLPNLSAGRNARVSYAKHADDESIERTLARAESLATMSHFSPLEHPAVATDMRYERHGRLIGFKPLRSFHKGEHNAALKRPDLAWLNEE